MRSLIEVSMMSTVKWTRLYILESLRFLIFFFSIFFSQVIFSNPCDFNTIYNLITSEFIFQCLALSSEMYIFTPSSYWNPDSMLPTNLFFCNFPWLSKWQLHSYQLHRPLYLEIIFKSSSFLLHQLCDLSAKSVNSTFKLYLESEHFSHFYWYFPSLSHIISQLDC